FRGVGSLVVVLALVAVACGGGSSLSPEDEGLVDEVMAAMDISPPEGFPPELFGDTEARCWAEAMLTAVGADGLRAVGFGADGFSDKEGADAALNGVFDLLTDETAGEYLEMAMECVDFAVFVAEDMIDGGLSHDAAYCIADKIVASDSFFEATIASMQDAEPSEEAQAELTALTFQTMTECLSPEELAELMGG
ncbi:MAG: hypothetical protein MUP76_06490, partial [Acidimicrobiia bacterium]|nr:hypothetical protein [Acidimicrobiia bacterium]